MYCKAFLEWPRQLLLDAIEINFIIIIIKSQSISANKGLIGFL